MMADSIRYLNNETKYENFSEITMSTDFNIKLDCDSRLHKKFNEIDKKLENDYNVFFSSFLKIIIDFTSICKLNIIFNYFNIFLNDLSLFNNNLKLILNGQNNKYNLNNKNFNIYKTYFKNSISYYCNETNYKIIKSDSAYKTVKYLLGEKKNDLFDPIKLLNYMKNSFLINKSAKKIQNFFFQIKYSKYYKNYFHSNFYKDWIFKNEFRISLSKLINDQIKYLKTRKRDIDHKERAFDIDNYCIYIENICDNYCNYIPINIVYSSIELNQKFVIFRGNYNYNKNMLLNGILFNKNNEIIYDGNIFSLNDYFKFHNLMKHDSLFKKVFNIRYNIHKLNDDIKLKVISYFNNFDYLVYKFSIFNFKFNNLIDINNINSNNINDDKIFKDYKKNKKIYFDNFKNKNYS